MQGRPTLFRQNGNSLQTVWAAALSHDQRARTPSSPPSPPPTPQKNKTKKQTNQHHGLVKTGNIWRKAKESGANDGGTSEQSLKRSKPRRRLVQTQRAVDILRILPSYIPKHFCRVHLNLSPFDGSPAGAHWRHFRLHPITATGDSGPTPAHRTRSPWKVTSNKNLGQFSARMVPEPWKLLHGDEYVILPSRFCWFSVV